jgi:hypothetical protein
MFRGCFFRRKDESKEKNMVVTMMMNIIETTFSAGLTYGGTVLVATR